MGNMKKLVEGTQVGDGQQMWNEA